MEKFRIKSIWWKQIQETMRNYPQEKLGCQFCHCTTLPQRCFLRSLLTRIRKHTLSPDFRQLEERPYQCDREGLARLARIAGMTAAPSRPYQQPCLHIKWFRPIKRQLKLTFESLDRLFHEIADQMAMRNYHLYLLEAQAKNAALTAVRLSQEGEEDGLGEVAVKVEEVEEKRNMPVRGETQYNQAEAVKMEKSKTAEQIFPPGLPMGGVNGGVGFFFGCSFYGSPE